MPVKDTEAKRLSPTKLKKTTTGLTALTQISNYAPSRPDYNTAKAKDTAANLAQAQAAEIAAQNALDKARDAATKAEWNAYNFMQIAAEQVMGQYGSSSDEYASLGYKKKSEYKKKGRKSKSGGAAS